VPPTRVRVVLSLLKNLDVASGGRGGTLALRQPALSEGDLTAVADAYQAKQSNDRDKLEDMMRYGQSATCRWAHLLEYFGESLAEPCGTCDNCRHPIELQLGQSA